MTFASLPFLVFLLALLPVHALLRRRVGLRNLFLLAASYLFYAAWDPRFLGLIVLSTVVDYLAARRMERPEAHRRAWLLLSVCVNLGLLASFKYFDFFAAGFSALAASVGWHVDAPTLGLVLPVGISFYTFQTLGYTIDVYRREFPAERNLLHFALFVAWFPQLVAGPIERARNLLPQLRAVPPLSGAQLQRGFYLIAAGLFKKVVLADNAAYVVDRVFGAAAPAGLDVWVAAYAFAIQIYCDFSGYTDMARGVSKCLGIELAHNFDRPYLAQDPRAFWRRWHITLGAWFRDYLYLPLGGRGGGLAGAARVLLVFGLAGLWHGAAWTFVLWGLGHGIWLLAWRALGRSAPRTGAGAVLCVLVTFHLVCAGWLLFRAESLAQLGGMLTAGGSSVLDAACWRIVAAASVVALVAALLRTRVGVRSFVFALPLPARVAVYLFFWFGVVLFGVTDASPFLYFRF
ncbi:MAG: MBOAT family protein [Planctomycetota bacterium]|nr:MBOAT family protein [Planctomycetota bacterium]